MSDFEEMLNALSGKKSRYSLEEIEKAQARAKKGGASFLDALQELTGRPLSSDFVVQSPAAGDDPFAAFAASGADLLDFNLPVKEAAAAPKQPAPQEHADAKPADDLSLQLDALNRSLERDFGAAAVQTPPAAEEPPAGIDAFAGVEEAVAARVYGQTTLIKKLTVAFKRPFVLPEEEGHARNCLLISGPEDTGRHYALTVLTEELKTRRLLASDAIANLDLSVYTAAGKDNVFLQDLYAALMNEACVLVLEGYEHCHISYLTYIRDLVMTGSCRLQDRYTRQKGQLVNVSNSFASETVSSFSATGKYLVFVGKGGVDALADVFGGPFVDALGDICVAETLTADSYHKIAEARWEELVDKAQRQLSFALAGDREAVLAAAVAATEKNAGTAGLISFFTKLLKSLATVRLEGSYEKGAAVQLSVSEGRLLADIAGEQLELMKNLPVSYTGALTAVKAELEQIVGLKEVKEYILSLEEYYGTQKRRLEAGLKASEVNKHMIFTGNPGTGKTTIARVVSRYLKAIGVLTGGQLVEVSRGDLVGRYVGHTAPLVNQVIRSAIGGVLFIDEAYSLYRGKEDSFGLEAIDTLVKGIEDNRDNLVVILAGYSNEMEDFLEANSGLRSRFPNFIDFPDYTGEELLAITGITVRSKGYTLDSAAEEALLNYYNTVQAVCPDTAGNGRLVRNKVEEAILNQSRRLVAEPEADLSLLMAGDFDLTDLPLM